MIDMMVLRSMKDIVLFLVFATLAAAWPWPPSLENIDALILRRQVVPSVYVHSNEVDFC